MDYVLQGNVLELNKDVKKIDIDTFVDIPDSVTKIVLSEGLEIIDDFTFSGCDKVKTIQLPVSLLKIGKNAFWHLDSLLYLAIPKSVESIDENAIIDCKNCTVLVEKKENVYGNMWYTNVKCVKFDIEKTKLRNEIIKILYSFDSEVAGEISQLDRDAFCDFTIDIFNKFPNFVFEEDDELTAPYIIAGNFVTYMETLVLNEVEITKCLEFIEDLHNNKYHCIQDLAVTGFVEDIQNTWSQKNKEYIYEKLLPKTKKSWIELNKFWSNK